VWQSAGGVSGIKSSFLVGFYLICNLVQFSNFLSQLFLLFTAKINTFTIGIADFETLVVTSPDGII